MRCIVTLTNGKVFTAKRTLRNQFLEPLGTYIFTEAQGKDAPAMNIRDRLHVPRINVQYMVEERR